MSTVLELTKTAHKTHIQEVKQASSVLLEHFNLNKFYYYKVTNSGRFFLFEDNLDVVESLESQHVVQKYPPWCHPKHHQNKFLIGKTSEDPFFTGLEETRNTFLQSNFNLWIRFIQKTDNAVEVAGFHSPQSDEKQCRFLFNHFQELRLFTKWFLRSEE